MNEKSNTKKSKRLVSAGVFITLYFVVFVIIGCCCMPVPPLYLCTMISFQNVTYSYQENIHVPYAGASTEIPVVPSD